MKVCKFAPSPVSPTIHITAFLLLALFTALAVGSFFSKIEIVARGQGKTIPIGRTQIIQPQRPGKIIEILIKEGQLVEKGEVLVRIDSSETKSDIDRINASIQRQQIVADVARTIISALSKEDPSEASFITWGLKAFSSADSHAADSEALTHSILNALRDEVRQLDAEAERINRFRLAQVARIDGARMESVIVAQKFHSSDKLQKQGTISRFDYLQRSREVRTLENQVIIAERHLDEITAEASAVAIQRTKIISGALATYRKELNEADITLKALQAELQAATFRHDNTWLRAPISGFVENLMVFTEGGFVDQGENLMSIVPSRVRIELEALFDNRDIGFLKAGQLAFVKFDAFPAERFGVFHGEVVGIGADARKDNQSGNWVYAVRLSLKQTGIKSSGQFFKFSSGMVATVDIVTGERRLISFFFEPIVKAIQDCFREP